VHTCSKLPGIHFKKKCIKVSIEGSDSPELMASCSRDRGYFGVAAIGIDLTMKRGTTEKREIG